MQGVLIYFLLNCYLVQFLVLFSTLSITFFTPFSAQTSFFLSKNIIPNRNFQSISSSSINTFSTDFTYDGTVRKSKKLQPQHTCYTCYVRCHLHIFKYKLSFLTFSVHISIYAWYPRIMNHLRIAFLSREGGKDTEFPGALKKLKVDFLGLN